MICMIKVLLKNPFVSSLMYFSIAKRNIQLIQWFSRGVQKAKIEPSLINWLLNNFPYTILNEMSACVIKPTPFWLNTANYGPISNLTLSKFSFISYLAAPEGTNWLTRSSSLLSILVWPECYVTGNLVIRLSS